MSVHWPIIRRCLRSPLAVACIDDQRRYRRVDMLVGALHVAAHLERVSRAPHVGILLPTGGLMPMAALGAWIAGRAVVPLNYLLKPAELQYVVDDAGLDAVVTAQPMLDFLGTSPEGVDLVRLERLPMRSVPEPAWPALASGDDLAVLLYTSGTSGRPKGVMLTHANLTSNIAQAVEWVNFNASAVLAGVLPQFHSFGLTVLTLLPLTVGCRVVYAARFVPHRIIRLLREHRPTALVAIPSMYAALLHVKDASAADFESVRFIVSGGEPLPRSVAEGFRARFGVPINEGYGLTETSPVTNWCRPHEYRPGSVGRALPRVVERIVSLETGLDVPSGQDGEVRIAGPNVMKGYYGLPAETAAVFDERGFLRTGDIGRFDADGHLYITGRLKEMMIIGGENVFPREIEEVLAAHPDVKDAGVTGRRDALRGEEPVAFVELREDADGGRRSVAPAALVAWCRERLAGYKVPSDVYVVEALPRGPTGKVLRRELARMLP